MKTMLLCLVRMKKEPACNNKEYDLLFLCFKDGSCLETQRKSALGLTQFSRRHLTQLNHHIIIAASVWYKLVVQNLLIFADLTVIPGRMEY